MDPVEGVVKYQEVHREAGPLEAEVVRELAAWRSVFYDLGVMGQDPARYGGAGFGNASTRVPPFGEPEGRRAFVITGTQTGMLCRLGREHFAVVERYDSAANQVWARGPVHASSEALTHGAVYDLSTEIRWVFHVHAPAIWRHRAGLSIPSSLESVPYGTPAMALEVGRLYRETDLAQRRIFAMAGHEDGIVTFGTTAAEAGGLMVEYLARARSL